MPGTSTPNTQHNPGAGAPGTMPRPRSGPANGCFQYDDKIDSIFRWSPVSRREKTCLAE
jgi:hypothetical protein